MSPLRCREDVVDRVVSELAATEPVGQSFEHRSIVDDAALYEQYWEQIPVLLVNGSEHAHWHVDPDRLRAAILEA